MGKELKVSPAKEFCGFKFKKFYKGITLLCTCYLDRDHVGEHVCGDCSEFPLEQHPYEGEDASS